MSGKESRDGRVGRLRSRKNENRQSKARRKRETEKEISKKKIEILLARFGTTSRDIDVRDKINELVRGVRW